VERDSPVIRVMIRQKMTRMTRVSIFERPSVVPLSFRPEQKENFT
jgi:hypothetical protein